jgi:ABC-type uncharacterized transport system ATPase subunit
MPGVSIVRRRQDYVEMAVPEQDDARLVLQEAMRRDAPVTRFEIDYPSLNDVFLTLVRQLPVELRESRPVGEERLVTV